MKMELTIDELLIIRRALSDLSYYIYDGTITNPKWVEKKKDIDKLYDRFFEAHESAKAE